jgi:putative hydrolase of the HAD superfamily
MMTLAPRTDTRESGPELGPDFRHVHFWLFDLDNTLYRADCGVFAQIEGRMTDYVARFTGLPRDEARALQKSLYRAHGTTLNGLMRLHGADPDDYLAYVHDIDLSALAPDSSLNAALTRLPGQRYVFTNGCRHHAARILERIGMTHLFQDIWDIRTIGFTPKPQASAYDAVVAAAGLAPHRAAMFDDISHNLVAARALGMTTVWLDTGSEFSQGSSEMAEAPHRHVSHRTSDLGQFLHDIRIDHDA